MAISASGCADETLFLACPFDKTVNENCAQGDGSANFTCVVTDHPQCPEDICLSWKNSEPFCSRPCTVGGHECPDDSKCATFNDIDNVRYCVSNAVLNQ